MKPDPSHRVKFILKRLGVLLLRYIFLCLYYDPSFHLYMPDGIPWKQEDFSPGNQQLFWRVLFSFSDIDAQARHFLTRGTFIRLHIVGDQLIPDYLILSSYHDILSVVAVGLHVDSPEEWPPLFGQIWQAYSVRRYWSHFWHLLVYRSFSAHAEYMVTKVTGTRKRTTMTRYANNACVFVLSGLMHALVERTLNRDSCSLCGCWATFWRYCLQVGAIISEEVFQRVIAELEHRLIPGEVRSMFAATMHRITGYIWVIFWTLWSKEFTFFPQAYCLKQQIAA
ncbi:Ff.00g013900.m01.CDS01 [Fusarium sp. VM40]|nr:Ff.00g013900.m01.CDS01 [Fusarium sp. VM40]